MTEKWICDECGSDKVEARVFVFINDIAQTDLSFAEFEADSQNDCYCQNCEDNTTLSWHIEKGEE